MGVAVEAVSEGGEDGLFSEAGHDPEITYRPLLLLWQTLVDVVVHFTHRVAILLEVADRPLGIDGQSVIAV